MVDVNVNFVLANDTPIQANFGLEPDVTYRADIVVSAATRDHALLYNRDIANQHPITAITGLNNVLDGLSQGISDEETRAKGVEQELTGSVDSNHQAISNHVSNKNNPHEVTKSQVGLGNCDNTSDANKPISTATQTALDKKVSKVSIANRVYGTNSVGGQTTYDIDSFGKVDDVKVGGTSVVTNKVANLGTMAGESTSDYSTTAQASLLYATSAQGGLADTALQPNDNISELTNNLSYQTATQVANSIAVETNNRESADNNLQSQIDAIVSASDVFDIVGTYAELQAYDISTVPVNDIIKVLEDSTHGGAATYYRCIETNNVKSWSYIGSEGASYTKAEADNRFVPQTRTVNNKALSSNIALTATDVGALPSSTVIPTVNDATVTIQKNGSTVSTFTLNQSSNETVNLTVPTKTSDIANDSGFITSADLPTNYVTTDTAQDIDAVKTFLGEKAIHFKQKAATNKLGFTLYNVSNSELGAFEYRPNTISGGALLNVNVPYTSSDWVGFRYWGTAVNVIAPKVATAGNYYIPVNFTDGNTTVTASSNGTVNLSSILPNSAVWGNIIGTLSDQTDLQSALNNKQDTLVSGTNIKTINSTSILGSGNITISAPTYTAGTGISITNDVISVTAPTLTNKATGNNSVTIVGNNFNAGQSVNVGAGSKASGNAVAYGYNTLAMGGSSVAIGASASSAGSNSTVIGYGAQVTADTHAIAIGAEAISSASMAIQLGRGTNSTAQSLSVGFGTFASDNYQLLDGTTGLIPDARISSNIARVSDIPTTPTVDGVTIDTNSSDELEAIGTVNKNTAVGATAVKYDWIGTLAEYNSQNVETLHPEWVCYITDDVSGGISVYTKAEVDSAISTALTTMLDSAFPVGSRYITEASTCPLATLIPNSTWVLTSQGRVLQGADSNHASGTTAGAGLPNITGNATYISSDGINQSDYPDSGAFSWENYNYTQVTQTISGTSKRDLHFDASRSNSIYGNSTTVQPPAEFVNIFKRIA